MEFHLASSDISAIRFGISPGHELITALRVWVRPQDAPLQWSWARHVRPPEDLEAIRLMTLVSGVRGYMPDFLTATPVGEMTPEQELQRLAEVSDERLSYDLSKMVDRASGAEHEALRAMVADPDRTRGRILQAWAKVWEALLAPVWPQMTRLLRADIAARTRAVGDAGLAAMVDGLHSTVTWGGNAETIRVQLRYHGERVECAGTGVVLVPSVMTAGRGCAVITEPPAVPTIFYPALGIAEGWFRDEAESLRALGELLGPTRARLILELHTPRSTSQCAGIAAVALSTASHHLGVLRRAGLIDSRRQGGAVLHVRSPLGEALASR